MHWKEWEFLILATVSVSHPSPLLHAQNPLIPPCAVLHANNRWLSRHWGVYLIKNHYAPGPLGPDLRWVPACDAADGSVRGVGENTNLRSYRKPLANVGRLVPKHTQRLSKTFIHRVLVGHPACVMIPEIRIGLICCTSLGDDEFGSQ